MYSLGMPSSPVARPDLLAAVDSEMRANQSGALRSGMSCRGWSSRCNRFRSSSPWWAQICWLNSAAKTWAQICAISCLLVADLPSASLSTARVLVLGRARFPLRSLTVF